MADTLNKECEKADNRKLDILIQVLANDTEGTKYGVNPDQAIELIKHVQNNCK